MREIAYNKGLGESWYGKLTTDGFPQTVLLELTYRCNLDCRHCYLTKDSREKEIGAADVKNIIRQIADLGCLHLIVTGGEPLMRPDIFEILYYARRAGLTTHLFTNGLLIDSDKVMALKNTGLTSLEVSFYSLDERRYDFLVRRKGAFRKLMNSIELLKKNDMEFVLKALILRTNFDEIADLKKFADGLDAKIRMGIMLAAKKDGSRSNLSLRLTPQETFEAINIIDALYIAEKSETDYTGHRDNTRFLNQAGQGEDKGHRDGYFFPCRAGRNKSLVIDPCGGLSPCLYLASPGISALTAGIKKGWKEIKRYTEALVRPESYKCNDCYLKSFCLSCPVLKQLESGDMSGCLPFYREIAELRKAEFERKNAAGRV